MIYYVVTQIRISTIFSAQKEQKQANKNNI